MWTQRLTVWSRSLLALIVVGLVGCAESQDLTGPPEPSFPSHAGGDGWVAERGHIDVCVYPSSPPGNYQFSMTVDGGPATTFTVQPNQCHRAWSRSAPIGSPIDPPATVVITQTNQPFEATYLGVGHVDGSAPYSLDLPARRITYQANYWHGGVAAFMSARGQGCVPEQWNVIPGRWAATGISPNQSFNAYFGVSLLNPDRTFDQALRLGTTPDEHLLARHAAAAIMNAQHGGVAFPLTTVEIRAIVSAADEGRVPVREAGHVLSLANHLGCPLTN